MKISRYIFSLTATLALSSNLSLAFSEEIKFDLSILSDDYAQAVLNDSQSSMAILLPFESKNERQYTSDEGIALFTHECTGALTCTYSLNGVVVDTTSILCDTIGRGRCQANCSLSVNVDGNAIPLTGSSGSCVWREVPL